MLDIPVMPLIFMYTGVPPYPYLYFQISVVYHSPEKKVGKLKK
jgi:hypothetical protein